MRPTGSMICRLTFLACAVATASACGEMPVRPSTLTPAPSPPAAAISVSGVVTDAEGAPVPAAFVELTLDAPPARFTYANDSGRFALSGNARTLPVALQLSADRIGYERTRLAVQIAPGDPISYTVAIAMKSRAEVLARGSTTAATIHDGLPSGYLAEPYDSPHSTAYRAYRLDAVPATSTMVELYWNGQPELRIWRVDGLDVLEAAGATTPPAVASIDIPAGRNPVIVVGTPGTVPAPKSPAPFELVVR